MWFLTKVSFEDDSVEITGSFADFKSCWEQFRKFLENPGIVENGAMRICEAADESEAEEIITRQRSEDIVIAAQQRGTPDRIVRQWARTYGVDMEKAVKLTTEGYRGGKSPEEWIAEELKVVAETGYDPGEGKGKIIKLIRKDSEYATVEFRMTVTTKEGPSPTTELYVLKNVDGKWLIHNIEKKGD